MNGARTARSHRLFWCSLEAEWENYSEILSDRCNNIPGDRRFRVNKDSFSGCRKYHKNNRIHTESINMPDTCTVFQAEIEAINHACQYALSQLQEHNIK